MGRIVVDTVSAEKSMDSIVRFVDSIGASRCRAILVVGRDNVHEVIIRPSKTSRNLDSLQVVPVTSIPLVQVRDLFSSLNVHDVYEASRYVWSDDSSV